MVIVCQRPRHLWLCPPAGNATGVVEWLHSLLGQSVDDASVGVAAAPMDWQPTAAGAPQCMPDLLGAGSLQCLAPAARAHAHCRLRLVSPAPTGEEKADQAQPPPPQRPKPARGLTVSRQPLDGWPPPPPPPRSQLALPVVPTVRLPEAPTQAPQKVLCAVLYVHGAANPCDVSCMLLLCRVTFCSNTGTHINFSLACCHQSAEGIRNDATVAHAAALGGLVARAEAEAAQRSAARRAAADWLRGDFTAEVNVIECSRQ
jgi:hypothetical protein